jgi:hypothetical protein
MAVTPVHATLTVTTATTRVQVTATTTTLPSSVYFEALGSNTGYIYIGLVTVTNAIYMARLSPGQGFTLSMDGAGGVNYRSGGQGLQLSSLYIDSSVSGEKVQMTYLRAQGG